MAIGLSVVAASTVGLLMSNNNFALAATHYHRSSIKKTAKTPYYSTSKTGYTYKFSGSAKKMTMKDNHALKTYINSTWYKSKTVKVTHGSKTSTYYFVTSEKNHASGWVKSSYLKRGYDYHMTNVKKIKEQNLVKKGSKGRAYTPTMPSALTGDKGYYVGFTWSENLISGFTYRPFERATIYIKGKPYVYYDVWQKDKSTIWAWRGYFKAGKGAGTEAQFNSLPASVFDEKDITIPGWGSGVFMKMY